MRNSFRRRVSASALAAILVALAPVGNAVADDHRAIAIVDVTVLTMEEEAPRQHQSVLIREGRIAYLGEASGWEPPPDAIRIEGRGRYLMPGLTDAHVHILNISDLSLYLRRGVTSVLIMNGNPRVLQWRDQIRDGVLAGPLISTTGPQLKVVAHPALDMEISVTSPDVAAQLVRDHVAAGYDFVKIWGSLDPAVYDALLREARAQGIRVTGHIPRGVGLEAALEVGQGSIAHLEEYVNKFFLRDLDRSRIGEAVALTVKAEIPVITTLATYDMICKTIADDMGGLLSRAELGDLDQVRRMLWTPEVNEYRRPHFMENSAYYADGLAFQQQLAAALHQAGVPLVAGSDAGATMPGLIPGVDLMTELELLADAGIPARDVLRMATRNAGLFLDPDDPSGIVVEGARADLVLLADDPRDSFDVFHAPVGVVVQGRWYAQSDLDELAEHDRVLRASTDRYALAVFEGGSDAAVALYEAEAGQTGAKPPFEEGALEILAFMLAEQGKLPDAVQVLQLISRAYPKAYLPLFLMAGGARAQGDVATARALYQRVLDLEPRHHLAAAILRDLPTSR